MVIRSRKSKKDRQYNGLTKKNKRTNNNLQFITEKTKIKQHEPHQKPGEVRCSGRVSSSCSTRGTGYVTLVENRW